MIELFKKHSPKMWMTVIIVILICASLSLFSANRKLQEQIAALETEVQRQKYSLNQAATLISLHDSEADIFFKNLSIPDEIQPGADEGRKKYLVESNGQTLLVEFDDILGDNVYFRIDKKGNRFGFYQYTEQYLMVLMTYGVWYSEDYQPNVLAEDEIYDHKGFLYVSPDYTFEYYGLTEQQAFQLLDQEVIWKLNLSIRFID